MRLLMLLSVAALLAGCAPPAAHSPTPTPYSPTAAPAPATSTPQAQQPPTATTGAPTPTPFAPDAPTPIAPTPTTVGAAAPARTIGYGQALAAAFLGEDMLAVGTTAGVLILSLPDLDRQRFIPMDAPAQELAASADGRRLAVTSYDGPTAITRLMNAEGNQALAVDGGQPVFSADSRLLAVAELDQATGRYTTRLYAVRDRAEVAAVPGDRAVLGPAGLVASFDLQDLVLSDAGGRVLLRAPAFAAAFSPDGGTIAVSSFSGVELLPLANGAVDQQGRRALAQGPAIDLAFTPEGDLLALTQQGVLVWGASLAGEPFRLRFDIGPAIGRFAPGATMIALSELVGDAPSTLRIIGAEDARGLYGEPQFEGGDAHFSADGRLAAVVTDAGAVRLVDIDQVVVGERRFTGYKQVAVAADGSIAAGRAGPQVDYWAPDDDRLPAWSLGAFGWIQSLRDLSAGDEGPVAEVEQVALGGYVSALTATRFVPNYVPKLEEPMQEVAVASDLLLELPAPPWDYAAGRLAWAGAGNEVLLAEGDTAPRALPALRGVPAGAAPTSLALSPDGLRLAVGFEEGTYLIVDVVELLPLGSGPIGGGEAITAITWSGDGVQIAYALAGGDVLVGEALDDDPLRCIAGVPRAEFGGPALALSGDGAVLAVGSGEGVATYRIATGAETMRIQARADDVALSPDGATLAAAVGGQVIVWQVP